MALEITEEELKILRDAVGDRGSLIFAMVCGSAAFNLATPTSDRDLFGVYLAKENGPFKPPKESLDSHDPDYSIYEVSKFAELLAKGNPKLVEPLYAKKLKWSSPEWEEVIRIRRISLNQVTVKQYLSYSSQKLGSAKAPKVDPKKPAATPEKDLYHAFRLAKEANRIAHGEDPIVYWEGDDREELMRIRRGEADKDKVMESIQVLLLTAEEAFTKLPPTIDKKILTDWVVKLKLKALKQVKVDRIETKRRSTQELTSFQSEMKSRAEEILRDNALKGKILFCAPIGSNALAPECEVGGSYDFLGVFVMETRRLYNVFEENTSTSSNDSRIVISRSNNLCKATDRYRRGFQLIELETFVEAVLKGSHVFTEALFYPASKTYASTLWKSIWNVPRNLPGILYHIQAKILNASHSLHYLGNAESLVGVTKKTTNVDIPHKQRRLAAKFLFQARKLNSGGLPTLNFTPEELTYIKGEKVFEATKEIINEIQRLKESAKTFGDFQRADDIYRLNEILLAVRSIDFVSIEEGL